MPKRFTRCSSGSPLSCSRSPFRWSCLRRPASRAASGQPPLVLCWPGHGGKRSIPGHGHHRQSARRPDRAAEVNITPQTALGRFSVTAGFARVPHRFRKNGVGDVLHGLRYGSPEAPQRASTNRLPVAFVEPPSFLYAPPLRAQGSVTPSAPAPTPAARAAFPTPRKLPMYPQRKETQARGAGRRSGRRAIGPHGRAETSAGRGRRPGRPQAPVRIPPEKPSPAPSRLQRPRAGRCDERSA